MSPLNKIAEKLVVTLLVILCLLSGGALFFEDQFTALTSLFAYDQSRQIDHSGQVLKIAYLFAPADLNPFSSDTVTQSRLNDVYEPLVQLDPNFNIVPVLAVYYGLTGDTQWTMHLRDGVTFHDGSALDADDVVYSYNLAVKSKGYAADLIDSVSKLEKLDDLTVKFTTKKPDPLFLNKLSNLLIVPNQWQTTDKPSGTGPYKIDDASDMSNISYVRNDQYWGELPYYEKVLIRAVPDKGDRVNGLLDKSIDFLVNVPPDNAQVIKDSGFNLDMVPSLEVGFVMFNMTDPQFGQKNLRKAVAQALNKTTFLDLAYGYAKTVNQFISNGVFGYNPDVKGYDFDLKAAEKGMADIGAEFSKIDVQVFYPESLKLLGQYFKEQLEPIGLNVEAIPLDDQKLLDGIGRGVLPFYYLGWRNERGDALPFLEDILHSHTADNAYGQYNGMNYSNPQVDKLIEDAQNNLNLQERLKDMQTAMKIAVEDDIVGVPLFETYSLFAYRPDLYFKPRVDSLVFPSTIRLKST